jgi:hypothetical protein
MMNSFSVEYLGVDVVRINVSDFFQQIKLLEHH